MLSRREQSDEDESAAHGEKGLCGIWHYGGVYRIYLPGIHDYDGDFWKYEHHINSEIMSKRQRYMMAYRYKKRQMSRLASRGDDDWRDEL